MSRHSVREAIRILEQKQIIKSRPGSGTFVVTEDESSLVEFLTDSLKGHARIVAAIRRRYADATHHAMNTHLDEIEKVLFKSS